MSSHSANTESAHEAPPGPSKAFEALLKRLRSEHGDPPPDPAHEGRPESASPLLWQLVFSILAWEASPARAVAACKRLHAEVIDYNELRVCLPDEIATIIGERYSRAIERATRLRSTLNDLFRRQHAVSLDHLTTMNKRDARAYLESLEGCPAYAAARVTLFELDGHAMPVDHRLMNALGAHHALPETDDVHTASTWLERQLRTGEAKQAAQLLEAWLGDLPEMPPPKTAKPKRATDTPKLKSAKPKPGVNGESSPEHKPAPKSDQRQESKAGKPAARRPVKPPTKD